MIRKCCVMLLAVGMLLSAVTVFSGCGGRGKAPHSFAEASCRTDTAPLTERFPAVGDIRRAWWKAYVPQTDRGLPGPNDYVMAGFMEAADWNALAASVNFDETAEPVSPSFPDGVDPSVAGFSDGEWQSCPALTEMLLRGRFMGEIYVDIDHRFIYFNVNTF